MYFSLCVVSSGSIDVLFSLCGLAVGLEMYFCLCVVSSWSRDVLLYLWVVSSWSRDVLLYLWVVSSLVYRCTSVSVWLAVGLEMYFSLCVVSSGSIDVLFSLCG